MSCLNSSTASSGPYSVGEAPSWAAPEELAGSEAPSWAAPEELAGAFAPIDCCSARCPNLRRNIFSRQYGPGSTPI